MIAEPMKTPLGHLVMAVVYLGGLIFGYVVLVAPALPPRSWNIPAAGMVASPVSFVPYKPSATSSYLFKAQDGRVIEFRCAPNLIGSDCLSARGGAETAPLIGRPATVEYFANRRRKGGAENVLLSVTANGRDVLRRADQVTALKRVARLEDRDSGRPPFLALLVLGVMFLMLGYSVASAIRLRMGYPNFGADKIAAFSARSR